MSFSDVEQPHISFKESLVGGLDNLDPARLPVPVFNDGDRLTERLALANSDLGNGADRIPGWLWLCASWRAGLLA